jgi:hypothetical protein
MANIEIVMSCVVNDDMNMWLSPGNRPMQCTHFYGPFKGEITVLRRQARACDGV